MLPVSDVQKTKDFYQALGWRPEVTTRLPGR